mmetsp:Transcript_2263/g.5303  ORF Transcript_2263/g.5303 Transcript_2263/m.5303 type:complete len:283 (-) Transcript_2263:114-962(-)|eukprot:751320-Hanusia_phi.AAC.3
MMSTMVAIPSPCHSSSSRQLPQKRRHDRGADGRSNAKKVSSSSRFYANVIAKSLKNCYQNETDPTQELFADAHSARHIIAQKMLSENQKKSAEPIQRATSMHHYTGPMTRSRSSSVQEGSNRAGSACLPRQPSFAKLNLEVLPHKIDTIYELSPSPENVVMYQIPRSSSEYVDEAVTSSSRRPACKSVESGFALRRNSCGSICKKGSTITRKASTPKSIKSPTCSQPDGSWGEECKVSWADCFEVMDSGLVRESSNLNLISRTQSFGATAMSEQFNLMRTCS